MAQRLKGSAAPMQFEGLFLYASYYWLLQFNDENLSGDPLATVALICKSALQSKKKTFI